MAKGGSIENYKVFNKPKFVIDYPNIGDKEPYVHSPNMNIKNWTTINDILSKYQNDSRKTKTEEMLANYTSLIKSKFKIYKEQEVNGQLQYVEYLGLEDKDFIKIFESLEKDLNRKMTSNIEKTFGNVPLAKEGTLEKYLSSISSSREIIGTKGTNLLNAIYKNRNENKKAQGILGTKEFGEFIDELNSTLSKFLGITREGGRAFAELYGQYLIDAMTSRRNLTWWMQDSQKIADLNKKKNLGKTFAKALIKGSDINLADETLLSISTGLASMLNRIANTNFQKETKSNDALSWRSSLSSIISDSLGEFAPLVPIDMLFDAQNDIVKALDEAASAAKMTGASHTIKDSSGGGTTVKTDISKEGGLITETTLTKQGKGKYLITGWFNISIKNYGTVDTLTSRSKKLTGKVAIQHTSKFINYCKKVYSNIYQSSEGYAVFNTLAFHKARTSGSEQAYRLVTSSILDTYLAEFLAGTGRSGSNGLFDLTSFLLVNGKFYSIYRILHQYIKNLKKQNSNESFKTNNIAYISLDSHENTKEGTGVVVANTWQGNRSSIKQAIERSHKVIGEIEKISMNAHLNLDVLENIAKTMKEDA